MTTKTIIKLCIGLAVGTSLWFAQCQDKSIELAVNTCGALSVIAMGLALLKRR